MGTLGGETAVADRHVQALEKELEECFDRYTSADWKLAQHFARRSAEALALALLSEGPVAAAEKDAAPGLDALLKRLVSARRIDVPIQAAFHLVRRTGNMGSHVQVSADQEPTPRSAELCVSNLVQIIEWFLDSCEVRSDKAARVVDALRHQFATQPARSSRLSGPPTQIVFGGDTSNPLEPHARMSPLPRTFAAWYQDVRPQLHELLAERLAELETGEGWCQPEDRATPALHVCVVGQAAVGKSTLINSLLDEKLSLLPAGGAGPHTASAIVVRHADDRCVEIRYVSMERIEKLWQGLAKSEPDPDAVFTARLLFEGNQFGSLPPEELARRLTQAVTGTPPAEPSNRDRVCEVVSAIRAGNRTLRHLVLDGDARFLEDLELHASGSLSPLTESVEVGWSVDMLAPGLCLVDLPGFGVASDKHAKVTRDELVRARAVLWVVDRAGLTEGTLQELRNVGFFRRVASSADDAPVLAIAVSRLDETARDARRKLSSELRPTFEQALAQVSDDVARMIRAQLRDALGHLESDERERVYERVGIFPVAPAEYRKLVLEDPDEPANVTHEAATGLPALRLYLRSLASHRRARAATKIDELLDATHQPALRALAIRLKRELRIVTPDEYTPT